MLERHQLRLRMENAEPERQRRDRKRREAWALACDRRDQKGWDRMRKYLDWQAVLEERKQKELRRERRVTAFHGVRTSWPRIERYAKYVLVDGPGRRRRMAA